MSKWYEYRRMGKEQRLTGRHQRVWQVGASERNLRIIATFDSPRLATEKHRCTHIAVTHTHTHIPGSLLEFLSVQTKQQRDPVCILLWIITVLYVNKPL